MSVNAQSEINNIKNELRSIISELESIERGVRNDFTGIGSDICATRLRGVLENKLYKARNALNNMDSTTVRKEFLAARGGG